MDFDGFIVLMDEDYKEFQEWIDNSEKHTLEEAKKGYNRWRARYKETLSKYRDLKDPDDTKNISVFMGKTGHFYQLSNFVLAALQSYTRKLEKEHEKLKLKKAKKSKKKRKKLSKLRKNSELFE